MGGAAFSRGENSYQVESSAPTEVVPPVKPKSTASLLKRSSPALFGTRGGVRLPPPAPKRAASARTAADEEQDQGHQARAQARPRREEVHEVDRPHVRDAGPVEPDGEEEEPQAEANE